METPRVVMFVMNTIEYDRRVLREATTLASTGHEVTVVGLRSDDELPAREDRAEGFTIKRVPVPWQPMSHRPGSARGGNGRASVAAPARGAIRWLVRSRMRWSGWSQAALSVTPAADVYHGHDLPGLGVAAAARARHRGSRLVYDSHDLFVESGANARRPRWAKSLLAMSERHLYATTDHLVTVNHGIAEQLHRRYGEKPTAVVHNCVPRWTPTADDRTLLRKAAGVPESAPLVLYHGGFSANRGLGQLIHAIELPALERAHLVLLGYGPMEAELRSLAESPSVNGRIHVLEPVPPDVLDRYVAGADAVAILNQPASLNELLSTPNKLFEALGAGVPVVTSDFPLRRQIVVESADGPLGVMCDPTDRSSIAAALATLLTQPDDAREAQRLRCLAAAHRRWNWEREQESLLAAYAALLESVPARGALAAAKRAVW
jgi:glycosyltransferase involved in cell wall biosynthesis